jgi:dTDP-4-dehydrorhamnose reductase
MASKLISDMPKASLAVAALAGVGLSLLAQQLQKRISRNRPMKVLLFGARGWIGGLIMDSLKKKGVDVVAATSAPGKESDDCIARELDSVQPTHVISVIGRTHGGGINTIDFLEGGPDKLLLNVRDNLYGPLLIARLCEQRDIHYTYYGTGCIFKYEGDHQPDGVGKTEDDLPNFFGSSYSVVKGFTDRLMHHFGDNVLNLRIRMPVTNTDNKRNFITKVAAYERVINIPNAMSYLPELFDHMLELMKQRKTGTLNFVNPGVISHVEVLTQYKDKVDPNHNLQVMTLDEQRKILAADRSNCKLDTTKLEAWCPTVRPIHNAMTVAMEGLAEDVKRNRK